MKPVGSGTIGTPLQPEPPSPPSVSEAVAAPPSVPLVEPDASAEAGPPKGGEEPESADGAGAPVAVGMGEAAPGSGIALPAFPPVLPVVPVEGLPEPLDVLPFAPRLPLGPVLSTPLLPLFPSLAQPKNCAATQTASALCSGERRKKKACFIGAYSIATSPWRHDHFQATPA